MPKSATTDTSRKKLTVTARDTKQSSPRRKPPDCFVGFGSSQ
jgi:hypothetical protein